MTTTPQAALLREAAQNALITLDGIASANPRDKADFETPDEWIAWAKSRARFAADALRAPVAQEVYAERILRQMMHESDHAQEPAQAGELPDEREAFKSWMRENTRYGIFSSYGELGWSVWQAATARAAIAESQAKQVTPSTFALQALVNMLDMAYQVQQNDEMAIVFEPETKARIAEAKAELAALAARKPLTWRTVIPGGKRTDEWESARVADYNAGWNAYRKAAQMALEKICPLESISDDAVDAKCLTITGHLLSRRDRDRLVWRMAEEHHGIIGLEVKP